MTQKLLFVLCLTAGLTASTAGQARTVTNIDLDRYRQQRVRAEQDLKDNYAKLGFPSPEELAKRNAESQKALFELADRFRQERLERERIEAERQAATIQFATAVLNTRAAYAPPFYGDGGVVLAGGFGGFGRGRAFRGFRGQPGYYAGGQFWPTGPRTPVRPLIAIPRGGGGRR